METVNVLVSIGGADKDGEFNYGPGPASMPAARAAQFVKGGHAERVDAKRKSSSSSASTSKGPAKSRRRKAS